MVNKFIIIVIKKEVPEVSPIEGVSLIIRTSKYKRNLTFLHYVFTKIIQIYVENMPSRISVS